MSVRPAPRPLLAPTIRPYRRSWLRGDVVAGLTVAALLVPQAMAYAQTAGMPAVTGLYASVLPLVAFALLSSSRHTAIGPNATVAVMIPTAVAPLAVGGAAHYVALTCALTVLVGISCALAGVLRAGFIVTFMSVSVLLGYVTGLSLTIMASQLSGFFGVPVSGTGFFDRVTSLARSIGDFNGLTVVVGLVAVLALVLGPRLPTAARWPWPLVVTVGGIAVSQIADLQSRGVAVVGSFPSGLSAITAPGVSVEEVTELIGPALGIALVAYIQTFAVAQRYADEHRYALRPNQELVALGAANGVAGLVQGFVVNGSLTRTAADEQAGGHSQAASLVTAGVVAAALIALAPVFAVLPSAVLSAIVLVTAYRLIEWDRLRDTVRVSGEETLGAAVALIGTLWLGPIQGLLVAVLTSLTALLYRASTPNSAVLGYVRSQGAYRDVERYEDAEPVPGVLMFRFDGPLFFANAQSFRERILRHLGSADPPATCLVVDAEAMTHIDLTGVVQFGQLLDRLDREGVRLLVTRAKGPTYDRMKRFGLVERIGSENFFPTNHAAVEHLRLGGDGVVPWEAPPASSVAGMDVTGHGDGRGAVGDEGPDERGDPTDHGPAQEEGEETDRP